MFQREKKIASQSRMLGSFFTLHVNNLSSENHRFRFLLNFLKKPAVDISKLHYSSAIVTIN